MNVNILPQVHMNVNIPPHPPPTPRVRSINCCRKFTWTLTSHPTPLPQGLGSSRSLDEPIYTFTYIHLLVNLAGGYVLSILDVFWWIPPLGTCWLSNWTCLSGQRDAYEKLDLCVQIRKGTAGHLITQRNRRAIFFSWFFDQSPACNQRKHQLWPPVWRFWSGPWLHMMQFALVTFQTRWVSLIHRISSLCRMLDIALGICNDAPDKQLGFLDSTAVVWHMPTIHGWCIAMLCFRCNQKPFSLSVPAPISFGAWYASLAAGVCVCISEDTLKNAQRACILLDSPQKGCMTWHDMISLNMLNKLKSIHLPTSDLMADLSGYVCAGGVYMEYWKSRGDNWRPKYDYGAALSALSSSRSVIHQDWAKKATDGPLSDPAWLLLSHKVWNPRRCLELLEMFGVWVCEQDDQWFLKTELSKRLTTHRCDPFRILIPTFDFWETMWQGLVARSGGWSCQGLSIFVYLPTFQRRAFASNLAWVCKGRILAQKNHTFDQSCYQV